MKLKRLVETRTDNRYAGRPKGHMNLSSVLTVGIWRCMSLLWDITNQFGEDTFESIFQLGGEAFISDDAKTIELEMNTKEPNLMSKLNKGLSILNTLDIHDTNGRFVTFNM